MTNGLVFFYAVLGSNFGLAILGFTIVSRVLLYPLTAKQLRQTRAMQAMQPRIKAIQAKFKNDKQRASQEQMKLFRESGVNPLGCLGPMIIQLPIWIGLFYAIRSSLADTPEGLVSLSQQLYGWLPLVNEAIPLNNGFLWMDLGRPDPSPIIMPVLVGASMWVVQKMMTTQTADPQQQSTMQMMNWMMPLMFGFFTLSFPAGLAVYWVGSNLVSIALQYRIMGWGGLARKSAPDPAGVGPGIGSSLPPSPQGQAQTPPMVAGPGAQPVSDVPQRPLRSLLKRIFLGTPPDVVPQPPVQPSSAATGSAGEAPSVTEGVVDETSGIDRPDSGGGDREGSGPTRRRPRRRRGPRRR
jgi:YidC/Oxa1 family membrane protein insertase